jgi:hypothetical protein
MNEAELAKALTDYQGSLNELADALRQVRLTLFGSDTEHQAAPPSSYTQRCQLIEEHGRLTSEQE